MTKISFLLLTEKGFRVLERFIERHGAHRVAYVVVGRDKTLIDDHGDRIETLCRDHGITFHERSQVQDCLDPALYHFAISWRWMINDLAPDRLIVVHDSILPKYRGFAPLLSMLINGESEIGITALLANSEYDAGPILAQQAASIEYPMKIGDAISIISRMYAEMVAELSDRILSAESLVGRDQDESAATYCLWRDEQDFAIDWSLDAARIRRSVDALGPPYKGSSSLLNGKKVRILEVEEVDDLPIEIRNPGKIIFVRDGRPVVVCGKGLLRIDRAILDETRESVLPLQRFRSRFH